MVSLGSCPPPIGAISRALYNYILKIIQLLVSGGSTQAKPSFLPVRSVEAEHTAGLGYTAGHRDHRLRECHPSGSKGISIHE